MERDASCKGRLRSGRGLREILFRAKGFYVAKGLGGIVAEGCREGMGAKEGRNGMGAEVDGPQGDELCLEVQVTFGGLEGLEKSVVGDAVEVNLGGKVREGNVGQEEPRSCALKTEE